MTKSEKNIWAVHVATGCLCIVLGLGLYQHTLSYPFAFDDERHIPDNPNIRLESFDADSIRLAAYGGPSASRPFAMFTFGVNYYFSEYDPRFYRLTNIVIHILNGMLVYTVTYLLLIFDCAGLSESVSRSWKRSKSRRRIEPRQTAAYLAGAVALIWLVHPLQTQSVTYIIQRMNSLAVFFVLAALCLYTAGRLTRHRVVRWVCFAVALLFWTLGLKTKQNAATLPALVFLIEWFFLQDLNRKWIVSFLKYWVSSLTAVVVVVMVLIGARFVDYVQGTYTYYDFTVWERVMTQFRVLLFYLTLVFFPHLERLNLDHDIPISRSLLDPWTTIPSLLVILLLLALSVRLARGYRVIAFCILWYFLNLAIESSIFGLEMAYEHRLYMPLIGVILASVWLYNRHISRSIPFLGIVPLVVLIPVLGVLTYQRNKVWQSQYALYSDCVRKSPNMARPHYNLGNAYWRMPKYPDALRHYRRATEIKPKHRDALCNLGLTLATLGQIDEAMEMFHRSLKVDPEYARARIGLGTELRKKELLDEAEAEFRRVVEIDPDHNLGHQNLAFILTAKRRYPEAIEEYRKALQTNPDEPEVHHNLGTLLSRQGERDAAIRHYRETLGLNPEHIDARYALANALEAKKSLDEAITEYRELLRLNPDHSDAKSRLEGLQQRRGNP